MKKCGISRKCSCGSGLESYELLDYRGIYISRVCDQCEEEIKSKYRPEIFTESYETEEPIDEEL